MPLTLTSAIGEFLILYRSSALDSMFREYVALSVG